MILNNKGLTDNSLMLFSSISFALFLTRGTILV